MENSLFETKRQTTHTTGGFEFELMWRSSIYQY